MVAVRFPVAVGSSGLIAIAFFWLLWSFVNGRIDVDVGPDPVRIDYRPASVPPPVVTPPPPTIVVRPPVAQTPDKPGLVIDPPTAPGDRTKHTLIPEFVGGRFGPAIPTPAGVDRDPAPTVRVLPDYPPSAVRTETEGWVEVQFTITATGRVTDAVVVRADPANVFDTAALKAVARWRYEPKIVDGLPVERVGMQTLISFRLDEQNGRGK